MDAQQPKFIDSEFFVGTPGNWHLLPGAPDDIVREFTEFMAQQAEQNTPPAFEPQLVEPDDE